MQGAAEQLGRDINDGDNSIVGHSGRPNDTEYADDVAINRIRSRNDAAIIEQLIAGFLAYEYLHSGCADTAIQQIEHQAPAGKRVKQAAQLVEIGKLREIHQVGLAGQDEFTPRIGRTLHRTLGDRDYVDHRLVHGAACLLEVGDYAISNPGEICTRVVTIQKIRGLLQLLGLVVPIRMQHPVLHFLIVSNEYCQHTIVGQAQEFDLPQNDLLHARDRHDASQAGDVR